MTDHEIAKLADRIVWHKDMRKILRDVVLRVVVEQAAIADGRAVHAFLGACVERGINIQLDEDDRIVFEDGGRLGADLSAVLTIYRRQITDHLRMLRDHERRMQDRQPIERARG